jgi:PQQ enzyme repeat
VDRARAVCHRGRDEGVFDLLRPFFRESTAREGYFFALDAESGKELWRINLGGDTSSSAITYSVKQMDRALWQRDLHARAAEGLREANPPPGNSRATASRRLTIHQSRMGHAEFFRQCPETGIGRPQLHSSYKSGCEQVNINPPGAPAVQLSGMYKGNDLCVRNHACLVHFFVVRQESTPAPAVPNQQLPIDQIVPSHFIEIQKLT